MPEDMSVHDVFCRSGITIKPLGYVENEITSQEVISSLRLKENIQDIMRSTSGVKYFVRMDMEGKTKFIFKGRDEFLNTDSKGLYVLCDDDEASDELPGIDPITLHINHTPVDKEKHVKNPDRSHYRIVFRSYTDIWFDDTEIGRANLDRLRLVLKNVYDNHNVVNVRFHSDYIDQEMLKSIFKFD